jgi:hypothetical protein
VHKKLWWEVHEPDAVELQPDKVAQDLFDQGRQVGEAARTRFPGGVLIDLPHTAGAERVAATQQAPDAGRPCGLRGNVHRGRHLLSPLRARETGRRLPADRGKSSSSQKDEHIPTSPSRLASPRPAA